MPFVPIEIEEYIKLHIDANPDENPDDLRLRLREALAAWKAGETCGCGNPIWVIGSAIAEYACFTCITMESVPDEDYEIAEAC